MCFSFPYYSVKARHTDSKPVPLNWARLCASYNTMYAPFTPLGHLIEIGWKRCLGALQFELHASLFCYLLFCYLLYSLKKKESLKKKHLFLFFPSSLSDRRCNPSTWYCIRTWILHACQLMAESPIDKCIYDGEIRVNGRKQLNGHSSRSCPLRLSLTSKIIRWWTFSLRNTRQVYYV